MKNDPKNVSTPIIVILYLLAVLFLGYGIYIAYDAVVYVNTYDTNDAVSASNMLQYVVAASASYFGFAIVIFAAAAIMHSLNKVQKNLYNALSSGSVRYDRSDAVIDEKAITEEQAIEEKPLEKELTDDIGKSKAAAAPQPAPAEIAEAPEAQDTPEMDEIHGTGEIIEAHESADVPEVSEKPEAAEIAEAVQQVETAEEIDAEAPAVPTPEQQIPEAEQKLGQEPETEAAEEILDASLPLAEELSSQFLAGSDSVPTPEIVAHQQPVPEIVIQQQSAPEIVVQQPMTPVTIDQQRPSPEAPAAESAVKPAEKLQPPTVPEEILQTKRKRGLKYETFSMDMGNPAAEYSQNLSDTIRLKKEDRESISSSFIKDLLEKNE